MGTILVQEGKWDAWSFVPLGLFYGLFGALSPLWYLRSSCDIQVNLLLQTLEGKRAVSLMLARGVHLRSWASVVFFGPWGRPPYFLVFSWLSFGAWWWCAPVAHAGTLSRRLADVSWADPGVLMILLMRLGLIPASLWFLTRLGLIPAFWMCCIMMNHIYIFIFYAPCLAQWTSQRPTAVCLVHSSVPLSLAWSLLCPLLDWRCLLSYRVIFVAGAWWMRCTKHTLQSGSEATSSMMDHFSTMLDLWVVGVPAGLCVRWLFVYISDILYQVEQCSGILFEVADVLWFHWDGVLALIPASYFYLFLPGFAGK